MSPLAAVLLASAALVAAVSVSAGVVYGVRLARSVARTPLPEPDPPLAAYGGLELLELRGVLPGGDYVLRVRRGRRELEVVGHGYVWTETASDRLLSPADGERVRALLALAGYRR